MSSKDKEIEELKQEIARLKSGAKPDLKEEEYCEECGHQLAVSIGPVQCCDGGYAVKGRTNE